MTIYVFLTRFIVECFYWVLLVANKIDARGRAMHVPGTRYGGTYAPRVTTFLTTREAAW